MTPLQAAAAAAHFPDATTPHPASPRAATPPAAAAPPAAASRAASSDVAVSGAPPSAADSRDEARPTAGARESAVPGWTFLTNHAHVLVALARDPAMRLRDVALLVGITERSVQSIVADLEAAGYLRRARVGRRNRYEVNPAGPLRHPAERDHAVGELLELFTHDHDSQDGSPAAEAIDPAQSSGQAGGAAGGAAGGQLT